jgi:hypothetical protein
MSTPVSEPVTPPQPDLEVYGVQELALFSTYTRDTYQAAFGMQAPAWDPTRLTKTWFDSTVDTSNPANTATYQIVTTDQTNAWVVASMTVPAQEAATVNLTGAVSYPPYVVAPTDATRGGSVLNPVYLSLESQAQTFMAQFGATTVIDEGATPEFPAVYPPDEPRRLWDIVINGIAVNAGALLLAMNAGGVGAPGAWDSTGGQPAWVPAAPAPTGANDTRPPRPMPVRSLLPNEKLQAGLMGVSVVRTDLQQQADQQAGQFTPDDRATLQQIYEIVNRLAG